VFNAIITSLNGKENHALKIANTMLMPKTNKNKVHIRKIAAVKTELLCLLTPKNIKLITAHFSVGWARRTIQPGNSSVSSIINKKLISQ
jgi:hypothetical protein